MLCSVLTNLIMFSVLRGVVETDRDGVVYVDWHGAEIISLWRGALHTTELHKQTWATSNMEKTHLGIRFFLALVWVVSAMSFYYKITSFTFQINKHPWGDALRLFCSSLNFHLIILGTIDNLCTKLIITTMATKWWFSNSILLLHLLIGDLLKRGAFLLFIYLFIYIT